MAPLFALYRTLTPRRRRQLAAGCALMLAGALAELVTIGAVLPFLYLVAAPGPVGFSPGFRRWIDLAGGDPVLATSLLLAAAAIAAAGLRLLLTWFTHRFVTAVGHDLAAGIFARMLRQPYARYVRRSSSEILSGIDKVQHVVVDLMLPAMQGITATFIALAILILLFAIDAFAAGAAALVIAAIYTAVSLATRRRLRRNAAILSEAATARISVIQEGLGGIRDILLDRSQPLFEEIFRRADRRYRRAQSVNALIGVTPRFVVEAAGIVAIALVVWAMGRQPGGFVAAIPILGALALGAQRLMPLLNQAYVGWSSCTGSLALLGDVIDLLNAPIVDDAPPGKAGALPFRESIAFEQVGYRHPEGGFALERVDLVIPRGARVGITGPTGSGKSSLLDLLMGLLEPDRGTIRIDGRALDHATRASWQAQLAHVPQAVYLADASIAANIAFAVPAAKIDPERLADVARIARIDAFVESLPEGYATRVGERGIRLSGGQRQRIGLARALYKKAPVLILDEATSALDDATEAAVMAGIMALGDAVTIILIAHRASTLAGCDRIIRMDEGRVVEGDARATKRRKKAVG
jgi:ATP-binding cassette subfamily B protein